MVRRRPPEGAVVPESTPVVAFGDPGSAWVATLGINPSRREFLDERGGLLDGGVRRLATLRSLGVARLEDMDDTQVATVVADCAAYFWRHPYRRWFDPLDQVLRAGLDASYYTGTACHLDLVQWATDPVWAKIPDPRLRRVLIDDGLPHLRAQLAGNQQLRVVVCNGRQVIGQVRARGLADLREAGLIGSGTVTCQLYAGRGGCTRWLGWSVNLQGSWGVSAALRQELAAWLGQAVPGLGEPAPGSAHGRSQRDVDLARRFVWQEGDIVMTATGKHADGPGHLPQGLRVAGKRELVEVLQQWLGSSAAATIGDVGSFGRKPWLRIDVGGREVALNADTTRAAVQAFIRGSAADPERPWRVIATRGGRPVKVLPGPDPEPVPGWYAYLTRPGTAGELI